ncbi:hypothetical protein MXAN_0490 [Myxococcus xanthus DK 1622]|uniref:Uncharacterized protein n=1 Tax=Myxococcus xanthus (strain DK1622) TaxID=246197 RepID=Q1DF13_MYXXD|nr:hypothetical protein MXAN_0490 [Myxococcus xanthus DK 1622]
MAQLPLLVLRWRPGPQATAHVTVYVFRVPCSVTRKYP